MTLFEKVINSGWTARFLTGVLCLELAGLYFHDATTTERVQAVPLTDPIFPPMERCLQRKAGTLWGFELSRIDIVTKHLLLGGLSQEIKVTVVKEGMGADDGNNARYEKNLIVFNAGSSVIRIDHVTRSSGPVVKWWDGGKVVAVAREFNACLISARATINEQLDIMSMLRIPRPVVQFGRTAGFDNLH